MDERRSKSILDKTNEVFIQRECGPVASRERGILVTAVCIIRVNDSDDVDISETDPEPLDTVFVDLGCDSGSQQYIVVEFQNQTKKIYCVQVQEKKNRQICNDFFL